MTENQKTRTLKVFKESAKEAINNNTKLPIVKDVHVLFGISLKESLELVNLFLAKDQYPLEKYSTKEELEEDMLSRLMEALKSYELVENTDRKRKVKHPRTWEEIYNEFKVFCENCADPIDYEKFLLWLQDNFHSPRRK